MMDEYKLRENYLFRFPGLTKHCETTNYLLSQYFPRIHSHFIEHDLMVQMFATDWYLTLFTSLVPIQFSDSILGAFIKYGWLSMYKFLLIIIERLEEKLLNLDDRLDMLRLIKPLELVSNDWNNFLQSLQKKRESLTWGKLVSLSTKKNIDFRLVDNFLLAYKDTLNV